MIRPQPDMIPGTIHLVNTDSRHGGRDETIVLNPTPSADPEDPLNWSRSRKLWNIAMVYIYVFGIGIATTVQYSILTNISEDTGIALADLNTGTGLMFLFAGLVVPSPCIALCNFLRILHIADGLHTDGDAFSGSLLHSLMAGVASISCPVSSVSDLWSGPPIQRPKELGGHIES